jgi:phosphocarrier protein
MPPGESSRHLTPVPALVWLERKIRITNKLGLHARPAALFVQTANQFECEIWVRKGKQKVNGKSIMGLMMLAAGPGSTLVITAEGKDAVRALSELERLIRKKFGEE